MLVLWLMYSGCWDKESCYPWLLEFCGSRHTTAFFLIELPSPPTPAPVELGSKWLCTVLTADENKGGGGEQGPVVEILPMKDGVGIGTRRLQMLKGTVNWVTPHLLVRQAHTWETDRIRVFLFGLLKSACVTLSSKSGVRLSTIRGGSKNLKENKGKKTTTRHTWPVR